MIVKVCGVRTPEIAEAALQAGADWIGVVVEPRSVRHVTQAQARAVAEVVRGRVTLVGVMVAPTLQQCEAAVAGIGLDALQLHGRLDLRLAGSSPVPVIPAINVGTAEEAMVERWWPDCLLLLDAAPVDEQGLPGGTGTRVDPAVAAALARHRPLILAGGLDPDNVAAAIQAVLPAGVDASTGLESEPGVKERDLVIAYVTAARAAAGQFEARSRR